MPINPSSLRSQQGGGEIKREMILPLSTAEQLAENAPASPPLPPFQSSYLEDEQWLGEKRPGLWGCELHRRTQCSGLPLGPENCSQPPKQQLPLSLGLRKVDTYAPDVNILEVPPAKARD